MRDPSMEFVEAHLQFLVEHLLAVVFCAYLIEAAGVPFPSRIILVVAATLVDDRRQLAALVASGTLGSLIGDHVPYTAGALTGPRILALYCRLTLGSERCVEKTVEYFTRYGAAAILLSRFSASVRLFASALSGCGHITYPRFITFDVIGTLTYISFWAIVGYVVGDRAAELVGRPGAGRLVLLVGPLALLTLLGYRLWRRRRYGAAREDALRTGSACLEPPVTAAPSERRTS
jgi:membrane protein DedA with SNARE-associated domain